MSFIAIEETNELEQKLTSESSLMEVPDRGGTSTGQAVPASSGNPRQWVLSQVYTQNRFTHKVQVLKSHKLMLARTTKSFSGWFFFGGFGVKNISQYLIFSAYQHLSCESLQTLTLEQRRCETTVL